MGVGAEGSTAGHVVRKGSVVYQRTRRRGPLNSGRMITSRGS